MNLPLHEDPEKTTSIGLIRYGKEFLDAAANLQGNMGLQPRREIVAPIPFLYLIGHSIELTLKSYLLNNGVSLRELRVIYGHDLERCLKRAEEIGLLAMVTFNTAEGGTFELLNKLYSTKQLEYIVTGPKHFPLVGPLHEFANKLLEAVSHSVGFHG